MRAILSLPTKVLECGRTTLGGGPGKQQAEPDHDPPRIEGEEAEVVNGIDVCDARDSRTRRPKREERPPSTDRGGSPQPDSQQQVPGNEQWERRQIEHEGDLEGDARHDGAQAHEAEDGEDRCSGERERCPDGARAPGWPGRPEHPSESHHGVQVAGEPALVRALPTWFVAGGARQLGEQVTANRRARGAIAPRVPAQAAAGS